jgi:xylulose-5-phosphate/fructose-6-phosphate phosphoketolase
MFNQHAKWLKVCGHIPWRRPIASLNYFLSSHVWRQDRNGFSHQDPGFIDHVVNKKAEVIRVYLPPDANTLLSVTDHCLRSRNYVNVVIAGKQPAPQWLSMEQAVKHCAMGLGIWEWASNDQGSEPDVVMACAGDVPTLETLAAVDLLRQHLPACRNARPCSGTATATRWAATWPAARPSVASRSSTTPTWPASRPTRS